jgi:hypothetical protein
MKVSAEFLLGAARLQECLLCSWRITSFVMPLKDRKRDLLTPFLVERSDPPQRSAPEAKPARPSAAPPLHPWQNPQYDPRRRRCRYPCRARDRGGARAAPDWAAR